MTTPIYPIVNLKPGELAQKQFIKRLLSLDPDYLQLRIKGGSEDDFLRNSELIFNCKESAGAGTVFVINDMADIADRCGARVLHVGQEDMKLLDKHKYPFLRFGLSTHSLSDIEKANELDLEYIGFGPVFASSTKSGHACEVFDLCNEAIRISRHHVVFIGGINKSNMSLLPNGRGIYYAVISAVSEFIE